MRTSRTALVMPAPTTTTPRSVEAMTNCSTMHVRKRSTTVRSTALDIDNLEKLKKGHGWERETRDTYLQK
jgi:hypothetical protein